MSKHNKRNRITNDADTPAVLSDQEVQNMSTAQSEDVSIQEEHEYPGQQMSAEEYHNYNSYAATGDISSEDIATSPAGWRAPEGITNDVMLQSIVEGTRGLPEQELTDTLQTVGNLAIKPIPKRSADKDDAAYLSMFDRDQLNTIQTTSGRIRYLHNCGLSRGQIAKVTGKIYQHVRNVLITPVKGK